MRGARPRNIDCHQARDLLVLRMDEPLRGRDEGALERHLRGCGACREVDAQHQAARAALRELPAVPPPRDLAPRTLAALEREAIHASPGVGRVRRRGSLRGMHHVGGLAFGSMATVTLLAIGALLLGPGGLVVPILPSATPFPVAPQQLAYLGTQGSQMTLYRTQLDRACPPASSSCTGLSSGMTLAVALPSTMTLSDFALDPAGQRAAIAGSADGATTYYVLDLATLPVATDSPAPGSAVPASAPVPWPTIGAAPTVVAGRGPGHAASPGAPSSGSRTPGATAPAAGSTTAATSTSRPSATATSAPRALPSPSGSASGRTAKATSSPTAAAVTRPVGSPAHGASASPSRTSKPSAPPPGGATPAPVILAPSPSPSGADLADLLTSASPSSEPAAEARPILVGVLPTGMPAAWSPDGSTLAFSARPADGSVGSDIYTWHPGDAEAVPLTNDHASVFASWAGMRVVGSLLRPDPADPARLIPGSFVIDPASGARREISGDVWLPSVDSTGRHVIYWSGDLTPAADGAVPGVGDLFFAAWRDLDPAQAAAGGTVADATASPSAAADRAAAKSGTPTSPAGTPKPSRAAATPRAGAHASASSPTGRGQVARTSVPPVAHTAATTAAPSGAPIQSSSATGSPDAGAARAAVAALQPASAEPVDPSGTLADRLGEWLVGWSADGSAFGLWTTQERGAEIGTLTIMAVDEISGSIERSITILAPTAAGRAFSLGEDRAAWTTPTNPGDPTQLRIAVWGPSGRGELRTQNLDERGVVLAFQ